MNKIYKLKVSCVVSILLLFFCGAIVHASNSKTKSMKGTVTTVAFGSHAGNLTVKNAKKEIEFFGNSTMKVRGNFPSVGDKVTVYYQETSSLDTPYIIKTLINSSKNR